MEKNIKCVVCGGLFTEEEISSYSRCPVCDTNVPPINLDDNVVWDISKKELDFLQSVLDYNLSNYSGSDQKESSEFMMMTNQINNQISELTHKIRREKPPKKMKSKDTEKFADNVLQFKPKPEDR